MTFQALISTVDNHFLQQKYTLPFDNYIVINQTEKHHKNTDNVFNYNEIGIAKSRNRALQKATADICLLSDDDIAFLPLVEQIVVQAFMHNPKADIITFQAQTPENELFKPYTNKQKWHNIRSLMTVTSFEIAYRVKSIANIDLTFDEQFGLGAKFATGEENIFLLDALRQGLKILYIPIPIVIHPVQSSGGDFNNQGLIKAKGAAFYRMFGRVSYIILLSFTYKKHTLSKLSYFKFYQLLCQGISEYKNQ